MYFPVLCVTFKRTVPDCHAFAALLVCSVSTVCTPFAMRLQECSMVIHTGMLVARVNDRELPFTMRPTLFIKLANIELSQVVLAQ